MHATKPFRTTTLIFWLTLILALAAVGIYAYVFHAVGTAGTNAAALQEETTALESQEAEVGVLKKNLAATKEREGKLTSYFVDANNPVPFFETLETYGTSTHVSVKFDSVNLKRAPDSLEVVLLANGEFPDLYRFIALLEAAPYEFTISKANVSVAVPAGLEATGKGTHSAGWNARITLSVTSLSGLPPAPASAPAAAPEK